MRVRVQRMLPEILQALPEMVVSAITLIVLIVKLHIPSFVGMADNGDYLRLMQPLGLHEIVPTRLQFDSYVNQY